ncbi:hypothetical protein WJ0W_003812 [Paenibacillus melissococcoides]|uniref:Uncharacterized protein n=1 Tax=Paenibacillus melissococcoides TaxID=2912268 RepID=A0ABM9G4B3_9BACL|nr:MULTISPECIES: hypothetical protein [Paenibacillus]MEB9898064.1 hypothetical protein [Bacillus cereus]CAH8246578.1 hypothetical protein WJ0W_003812 [Paenibacillus melissococcoides]CAH8715163.1 hypothetical protein HTL2_004183 [Paenibacillus melissococcoides]CAH8716095.1 hypothetical protein WDD9_004450 [Paenibacillus melissococcoides]GIO81694.1 hypothetical protein J6TS7_53040 [Paenibacillus dendritiformis]
MIGFLVIFLAAGGGALVIQLRTRTPRREIGLFVVLSVLGCIVWISIFMGRKINPTDWIAWVLDRLGW